MKWLSDSALTKRHCGVMMMIGGFGLAAGMLAMELVSSASDGFGAIQQIGLAGGLLGVLIGITLLPLGDQPA